MSEEIPTLNLHRGKSWSEWTKIVGNFPDISVSEKVKRKVHPSVYLLPRKDILLYGCCPKMDIRVLCQCSICGKVMIPSGFSSHCKDKHGPDQSQTPAPIITPGTSLLKKKHPHTKTSKKKPVLPTPVPPPPLFPRQATPPPSPINAPADLSPPILLPVQVTKPATPPPSASLSSPTNNIPKHKKSKKSYKKIKEYDPDKHCGVIEGHKGPCLRSITCSNHMVLLRKAVPGRSKDFQQLIADHKAAKDKETSKQNQMLVSKVEPTTSTSQNATFRNVAPTYVKIAPTPPTPTTAMTTKPEVQVISQPLHVTITSPAMTNSNSQRNSENCSSSVVYMPMSPVGVVSPVQFVQLEGTILRVASTRPLLSPPLGTQPIVVTIPVQNHNTPMYTSHPKPLIMSTCSTRKVGGTFVLQNERIDRQRSEIQMAANTRRSIANSCSVLNTHHHKPNILKNTARGASLKINSVKRQNTDKLINDTKSNALKNSMKSSNIKVSAIKRQAADSIVNDTKQIRLNDVNGFILHADVSEGAEAPQSNNSIHDKITFINMK